MSEMWDEFKMKTLIPIIIIAGTIFLGLGLIKFYRMHLASQILRERQSMTKQEIVLECQKLAAIKTTDDWKYKDCLDELKKAPNEEGLLKI